MKINNIKSFRYLMLAIILLCLIAIAVLFKTTTADAKKKSTYLEYLGKWYVSTYTVNDNTPAGTRNTSTGEKAQEWLTGAVDYLRPLVPIGTIVAIYDLDGNFIARIRINDYGGFGKYNGGRRAIDLFVNPGEGFCKECKIYIEKEMIDIGFEEYLTQYRLLKAEEDADRRERLLKFYDFQLIPDETLEVGTIATDPEYILGGTVRIGDNYYEVARTDENLGRVIKVGAEPIHNTDLNILNFMPIWVKVTEVYENAVG